MAENAQGRGLLYIFICFSSIGMHMFIIKVEMNRYIHVRRKTATILFLLNLYL